MVQNYQKFNSCYTFLFTRVQNLKGTVPSHQFQITIKGVTDSPVSPRSKQDTFPVFTHYLVCAEPQVYTLPLVYHYSEIQLSKM